MTPKPPAKAPAAPPRSRAKSVSETPKRRAQKAGAAAKKGAQPAKKAAKRAPTRRKPPPQLSLGDQLRADLAQKGDAAGTRLLIMQAGRNADRLEAISKLLAGDVGTWCTVTLPRTDAKRGRVWVEVRFDALMVEERSRMNLLRQQLATIDRLRGGKGGVDPDEDDDLVD